LKKQKKVPTFNKHPWIKLKLIWALKKESFFILKNN
jgi:hypothetical protein